MTISGQSVRDNSIYVHTVSRALYSTRLCTFLARCQSVLNSLDTATNKKRLWLTSWKCFWRNTHTLNHSNSYQVALQLSPVNCVVYTCVIKPCRSNWLFTHHTIHANFISYRQTLIIHDFHNNNYPQIHCLPTRMCECGGVEHYCCSPNKSMSSSM